MRQLQALCDDAIVEAESEKVMTNVDPQCEPPRELMRETRLLEEVYFLERVMERVAEAQAPDKALVTRHWLKELREARERGGYGGLLK